MPLRELNRAVSVVSVAGKEGLCRADDVEAVVAVAEGVRNRPGNGRMILEGLVGRIRDVVGRRTRVEDDVQQQLQGAAARADNQVGLLDYQKTGMLCGIELPPGLGEASRFDAPLFTPATKAELGEHDENISLDQVAALVGRERAGALRDLTLRIYLQAADHALRNGIIIADTKFEFGVDEHGELVLADEVFTPDSSRYWPADEYRAGVRQHSFDKQFVRNWLTGPDSGWDRSGSEPPPPLPEPSLRWGTWQA